MTKFEIDTGDAPPVHQKSYRHSESAKREIERQIDELLEAGIIEPSVSPWASPIVLVKKKTPPNANGSPSEQEFRLCIDYRHLNKLTKPIYYQMPSMLDVIDTLSQTSLTISPACPLV